jgi:hypothetical protein
LQIAGIPTRHWKESGGKLAHPNGDSAAPPLFDFKMNDLKD